MSGGASAGMIGSKNSESIKIRIETETFYSVLCEFQRCKNSESIKIRIETRKEVIVYED